MKPHEFSGRKLVQKKNPKKFGGSWVLGSNTHGVFLLVGPRTGRCTGTRRLVDSNHGDGWVEMIFLKEKNYTPGSINIAGKRKAGF